MTPPPELLELAERFHCRAVARIEDAWLDRELTGGCSVDFLRGGPVLPVRVDGQIYLCTADPMVEARMPEISVLMKGEVQPLLATEEEVRRAIDRCFARRKEKEEGPPGSMGGSTAVAGGGGGGGRIYCVNLKGLRWRRG